MMTHRHDRPRLRIDIVFDTVCPWCFVGKRRMDRALARRPGTHAELYWRPFLLNPDMPPAGLERDAYLEAKFGGQHRAQRVFGAVKTAGDAVGISFAFDRIERTPATIDSHRLVRFAEAHGRQADAVEALFQAYFIDGRDIGDSGVLLDIARHLDLDADALRTFLRSEAGIAEVFNDNTRSHRLGVSGVPCFIFNESYAVAGAQEVDVFLRLIDLAVESGSPRVLTPAASASHSRG
ncbi:MAG: DsbA family oxidoreductase [Alphaproteobacteria bacterium]